MTDCVVIGGGIIGMLTALNLIEDGMEVTLLEKGHAGRESSWAGGGIISPLYPWRYPASVSELARWSQELYPQLAEELAAATGIDPEYTPSGLLILDTDEQHSAVSWSQLIGSELEILDRSAISQCEPQLGVAPESALWLPQVAQIRNPRMAKAARLLVAQKARLREDCTISEICAKGDRITGVRTDQGMISTRTVIVCTGAWTAPLLDALGTQLAVEPVKGQMILFRTQPGLISRIVLSHDRYAIPRRDGRILVGSTLEHQGFNKTVTSIARTNLLQEAARLFPILADYPIEKQWAGLRPGSPAGIPFIAPHPKYEGLFVNAGHFRNGVVLAPGSARLMADLVLGRTPIVSPQPFALDAPRD